MAETDISAIDERLRELLSPLKREEETLMNEKDTLKARLAEVDAALTRVRRVRAVAFPEPRPVVTRQRRQGSSQSGPRPAGGYISDEKLRQVTEYMQQQQEPVTIPQIKAALDMSEPTVSKGLQVLRDQEKVRLTGTNSKNARLFAWMESKPEPATS